MKSLIVVLAMMVAAPTFAKDGPASEASVRKMMELSKVRSLLDSVWDQMDTSMNTAVKSALNGQTMSPEQQRLFDDSREKMVAILREELSWDKIEPIFVDVYSKTFTQKEIDGISKFYQSKVGQAMVAKLPQVMQATSTALMSRLQAIIPRMQAMQQQLVADMKASAAAK